jgi:predicted double-glycine peptidase
MVVQYVTDEVYHPYTFYEEMNSQKHKVTSGFDLAEWMTLKGVSAKYEYGWTIEQLRITVESGKPVIAYLEQSFGGHFVVVIGVMDDVVYIHDPGVGPVVGILIEEFEYMWSYPASWQHNRVIAYEEGGE